MDELEELVEPKRLTEEMKSGLARLYSDDGIRSYINNAIAIQNKNVLDALKLNKPEAAREHAARIDTLQRLLEKGKSMFHQAEKLRTTPLEDLVANKPNDEN